MFKEVFYHRLKYMLSPQLDLYENIAKKFGNVAYTLDYGCGTGFGTLKLIQNGRLVSGIDEDEEAIEFARTLFGNLGIIFNKGNWASTETLLNPSEKPWDLIVCVEVIEHVESPRRLLSNMSHALSPKGSIVISTLNHDSQYRKNKAHKGKYKVPDFRRIVNEFFPGAKIYDYTLEKELTDKSTVTPMVAVWKGKQ